MAEADQPDLTTLTVELLSAYFSTSSVPSEELAGLIKTTHNALIELGAPPAEEATFTPAVSVRKSLASRDHIISMIDGRPYKTLKRHLATHGLSPKEYRERYKLAPDYPMVAPGYSDQRRAVAEKLGLGRKRTPAQTAPEAAPAEQPTETPASNGGRGGRKKAAAASAPAAETPTKTRRGRAAAAPATPEASAPKRGRRKASNPES